LWCKWHHHQRVWRHGRQAAQVPQPQFLQDLEAEVAARLCPRDHGRHRPRELFHLQSQKPGIRLLQKATVVLKYNVLRLLANLWKNMFEDVIQNIVF